jgi:hypothetical protein
LITKLLILVQQFSASRTPLWSLGCCSRHTFVPYRFV